MKRMIFAAVMGLITAHSVTAQPLSHQQAAREFTQMALNIERQADYEEHRYPCFRLSQQDCGTMRLRLSQMRTDALALRAAAEDERRKANAGMVRPGSRPQ